MAEEELGKRYTVYCKKNHHVVTSFDELADAKRIADSYTTHRLSCVECGCQDWKYEDTEASEE